jgi:hypothetical protein
VRRILLKEGLRYALCCRATRQLHEEVGLLAPNPMRRRGTLVPGLKYWADIAPFIDATMKGDMPP